MSEANRVVNEAIRARNKVEAAAAERIAKAERDRKARQKTEEERREAMYARLRADREAEQARAQHSFEERVDAFTEDLRRSLADHDLKLLGGWSGGLAPQYTGTHVEVASTTSEHKATIRVQIGQGLKR